MKWSFADSHTRIEDGGWARQTTARTFDYTASDPGIVPKSMRHCVENLSDTEEVEMLEIFRAPRFEYFSLEQWLASSPARNVAEHLFQANPKVGEHFVKELSAKRMPVKSKL
ncbi:hypothetical protein F5Y05DRAFT_371797 [Hypoxylon sp. FL0543]|nr:hypothetical protein F5Y05DRAFT_371797 [Hypoxylon sp. FL0543]